jgi:hypothetical protein
VKAFQDIEIVAIFISIGITSEFAIRARGMLLIRGSAEFPIGVGNPDAMMTPYKKGNRVQAGPTKVQAKE